MSDIELGDFGSQPHQRASANMPRSNSNEIGQAFSENRHITSISEERNPTIVSSIDPVESRSCDSPDVNTEGRGVSSKSPEKASEKENKCFWGLYQPEGIEKGELLWSRWAVDWWALEILSVIFSIICMTVVVITLAHYDGKEPPQWRQGMTLDMFVSIFSGLAKSLLLFPTAEALGQCKWIWFHTRPRRMFDFEILDQASRGAWGSFWLLARSNGITLPSIGAGVIVFLSLPLGLLSQFVIQYDTIWVAAAVSCISRVVKYSPVLDSYTYGGVVKSEPDSILLSAVQPLLYGVFAPKVQPYVSCTTNRCSWRPFNTLGLCTQCAPLIVSDLLNFGCNTVPDDWRASSLPTKDKTYNGTVRTCGYYLQPETGIPILMSGYAYDSSGKILEGLGGRMLNLQELPTQQAIKSNATMKFKHIQNPIIDFILSLTEDGPAGAIVNSTPAVWECVSSFCVKTFQSAICGSTLSEDLVYQRNMESWHLNNPSSSSAGFAQNYSLMLPGQNGENETFVVDDLTARSVYQVYEHFIPSSMGASDAKSPVSLKLDWKTPRVKELNSVSNPWSPANGARHIQKITEAMSTAMRLQQSGNQTSLDVVNGEALEERVHVNVNWIRIQVPGVLLLLFVVVFLAKTITASSKWRKIYKNSALAILFNGVSEELQSKVGDLHSLRDTHRTAEDLVAQIE